MILQRQIPWQVVVAVAVAAAIVLIALVWRASPGTGPLEVHYPYWCKDCKAVFDVEEVKTHPKGWRIAPRGPNDSVVVCPKCDKGQAHPVATCNKCGKKYVLYLAGDGRCPRCYASVAKAAKEKGVNLTPPEIE